MRNRPNAFLSYTRVDDKFFGGAITALRDMLELGVQVVTGQSITIFQDIDGIEFGQQWQKQLDEAVSEASLLIAIITPSFLRSDACRDELNKFIQKEKLLGRDDLILPIYFVTVPLLEKGELLSADSLALEIKRRQWYDWRAQASADAIIRRDAIINLSKKISEGIGRTEGISKSFDVNQLGTTDYHNAIRRNMIEETSTRETKQKLILWVDDNPDNNSRT